MAEFLRYILKYSESNMYLMVENKEALLVDPHPSDEAVRYLDSEGVKKIYIMLTHEHFDHTSGVNWFRNMFDTQVICHNKCAESISIAKNNRPFVFFPMVENKTEAEKQEILAFYDALPAETIESDVVFDDNFDFDWQGHHIYMRYCPGHSMGSSVILFDDSNAFTGDYMIPDVPVILRFPGGSKELYRSKTLSFLLDLDDNLMIMPGHGEPCLRKGLAYNHGVFIKY